MNSLKFPFDSVIILSDTDWSSDVSVAKVVSQDLAKYASVYYVSRVNDKDFTEISKSSHLVLIDSCFDPKHTLEMVLSKIPRANRGKLLVWVQSVEYYDLLQSINLNAIIVFQFKSELIELNLSQKISSIIKESKLLITENKEAADYIANDVNILTPAFTFEKNPKDNSYNIHAFIRELERNPFHRSILNEKRKKNVLLVYSKSSCYVATIEEHLNAFGLFSKHHITYLDGTEPRVIDKEFINGFDAIAIHFSIRVSVEGHLFKGLFELISNYYGLKLLFIQDEYDNIPCTYRHIDYLKIDVVYSVIKEEYINYVYPRSRFPNVRFIYNLTGYVSYKPFNFPIPRIKDRSIDVFYRGRKLPLHYGTLGREKYEIGKLFKKHVQEGRINMNLDIESEDKFRIYGNAWYDKIVSSKVMLGTESGSNVFDFDGDLERKVNECLAKGFTEDQLWEKELLPREKDVKINTISPKVFESIALKTALVLFEGEYAGVLQENRHYIPLKKDFSNFQEVVEKINDNDFLQKMVDISYEEISKSDKFTYPVFIQNQFDSVIDEEVFLVKTKDYNASFGYFEKEYVKNGKVLCKYLVPSRHIITPPTITVQESDDFTTMISATNPFQLLLTISMQRIKIKILEILPLKLIKPTFVVYTYFKRFSFIMKRILSKFRRLIWR